MAMCGILQRETSSFPDFFGSLFLQPESRDLEQLLVSQAVGGNVGAFSALYDRHVDAVYRHVSFRVADAKDAEDITQDTFIKAWKYVGKYKQTGAPFVAWLLTIAHNAIADHYRRRKNYQPLDEDNPIQDTTEDPQAATEALFTGATIRQAVCQLKDEKQNFILMRFIDGMSYEEIAKSLKKTEGAIRVIQFRALKELKDILARSPRS